MLILIGESCLKIEILNDVRWQAPFYTHKISPIYRFLCDTPKTIYRTCYKYLIPFTVIYNEHVSFFQNVLHFIVRSVLVHDVWC